jgi:15-cis-phytoene synthase
MAPAMDDLLTPECRLALAYAKAALRPSFTTLFLLDATLGRILAQVREPHLAQIRLAWWRAALDGLSHATAAPNDPVLAGCGTLIRRHDVTSAMLSGLTDGWEALLETSPLTADSLARFGTARGHALFAIAGRIAGVETAAGAGWALMDFSARCSDPQTAALARTLALSALADAPAAAIPPSLRPFGIITRFAERDAACGKVSRGGRRIGQAMRYALFN